MTRALITDESGKASTSMGTVQLGYVSLTIKYSLLRVLYYCYTTILLNTLCYYDGQCLLLISYPMSTPLVQSKGDPILERPLKGPFLNPPSDLQTQSNFSTINFISTLFLSQQYRSLKLKASIALLHNNLRSLFKCCCLSILS